MQDDNTIIASIKLLISRLEHLSADSRYAHRASGLRGSLWRCVEEMEARSHPSGNCDPSSASDKSQLHCDLPHALRPASGRTPDGPGLRDPGGGGAGDQRAGKMI
ncbi:MAG: hypothetical protein ABSE06_20165 [Anaerolineaceae bacterium]